MENYTNKQLTEIYNACRSTENNLFQGNSDFLLREYNKVFQQNLGNLHFYMVLELYEKVEKEMASRFAKMNWE